jgi:hypothetical protein
MLQARSGNREAISEACRVAEEEVETTGRLTDPDVLSIILVALGKVAKGESPNDAFGWSQPRKGRRKANSNFALDNWEISMDVHLLMKNGRSWTKACEEVSNDPEVPLSAKQIENICKDVDGTTPPVFPENPFPICRRKKRLQSKKSNPI